MCLCGLRIIRLEKEGKKEHGCRPNPQDYVDVDERQGGGLHHEGSIDLGHDGRLGSKRSQSGAAGVLHHGLRIERYAGVSQAQMVGKPRKMELLPPGQNRLHHSGAKATSDVAHEVGQSRDRIALVSRNSYKRGSHCRNEDEGQGNELHQHDDRGPAKTDVQR